MLMYDVMFTVYRTKLKTVTPTPGHELNRGLCALLYSNMK